MTGSIEEQVAGVLRENLPRIAAHVEASIARAIRLSTTPVDDEKHIAIGASKFGGLPDLPREIGWPEWEDVPLDFLGQVYLPDVAPYCERHELPRHGLLSFFFGAGWRTRDPEQGTWRVVYFDGDLRALRRSPRQAASPQSRLYRPCALSFREIVSLPEFRLENEDRLHMGEEPLWRLGDLTLSEEEADIYDRLHSSELREMLNDGPPDHQILGYPSSMRHEVDHGPEWRLLAQIDSDDNAGMNWDHSGKLYFSIRQQDLAARDFSDTRFDIQS